MKDDPQAQTEVLLRRALGPILQDTREVPESIVRGAVQRGRRRRRVRRAGVALVPLVAAAAVAVTVVSIRFSTGSPDGPPTDSTRMQVWQPAAESPLSPRSNPTVVQVGGDVVVLGGSEAAPCPPNAFCVASEEGGLDDGAVYEPDRDVWRGISPAPVALENISATVSGSAVYVLTLPGSGSGQTQQLWEYSLTGDRWTRLLAPPHRMDSVRSDGADGLIASVTAHARSWTADQSYDIASRTWSPMPRDPLAPSQDRNLVATGSGDLVLIAVDREARPDEQLWAPWRTAQWDAGTRTWKEIATPGIVDSDPTWWWAAGRVVNPTAETVEQDRRLVPTGGILDPVAGTWQTVPATSSADPGNTYPWLEAAGAGRIFVRGELLDVGSRTWTPAPRTPARFPTQDASAIIVDDRMIVFGGATFSSYRGTLTNDTWVLRLPAATS